MDTEYINILIESLEKKRDVLAQLIEFNRQQMLLLQDPGLLPADFEKNMTYKSKLVEQLDLLDTGFEEVFGRVKGALEQNREAYAEQIGRMQTLVRDIMAQTNTLQTQEARNKEQAARKFSEVREQVKGVRNSQKVVRQYYQNMMKQRDVAAQVIDNKK